MISELKRWCEYVRTSVEAPVKQLDTEFVWVRIAAPVLKLIGSRHGRWLTVSEAVLAREKGQDDKHFTQAKPKYGGRSLLQVWEEQGLAVQTLNREGEKTGPWLINPLALAGEFPAEETPPAAPESGAESGPSVVDEDEDPAIEAAVAELTRVA